MAKTFELAINEVSKFHPAAESILVLAALAGPEPIPLFLFSKTREYVPFLSDADDLEEVVISLKQYSLVTYLEIKDQYEDIYIKCIKLHRVLSEVSILRINRESRDDLRVILMHLPYNAHPSFDEVMSDHSCLPYCRIIDPLFQIQLEKKADEESSYKDIRLQWILEEHLSLLRFFALAFRAVSETTSPINAFMISIAEMLYVAGECSSDYFNEILLNDDGSRFSLSDDIYPAGGEETLKRMVLTLTKNLGSSHEITATWLEKYQSYTYKNLT